MSALARCLRQAPISLAIALADLVATLDPDVVVIGGGLGIAGGVYGEQLNAEFAQLVARPTAAATLASLRIRRTHRANRSWPSDVGG